MKNNNLKLGIFDSGSGGLSVLDHILNAHIFKEIIYYGDTARLPYGTKHPQSIVHFSLEALDFLITKQVDMIIVACNTASAYALNAMQKKIPHIPVIGVIEPGILAIKNQLENLNAKVLIIGTKATIASQEYQKRLQKIGYCNLTAIATSLLVALVEENIFQGKIVEESLKYYFHTINFVPDAIILGCTHFPLLKNAISNYFNNQSLLIHSGEAIVEYINHLIPAQTITQTTVTFFASSDVESLIKTAKNWLTSSNFKIKY